VPWLEVIQSLFDDLDIVEMGSSPLELMSRDVALLRSGLNGRSAHEQGVVVGECFQ
jgi:hypothetical protein